MTATNKGSVTAVPKLLLSVSGQLRGRCHSGYTPPPCSESGTKLFTKDRSCIPWFWSFCFPSKTTPFSIVVSLSTSWRVLRGMEGETGNVFFVYLPPASTSQLGHSMQHVWRGSHQTSSACLCLVRCLCCSFTRHLLSSQQVDGVF